MTEYQPHRRNFTRLWVGGALGLIYDAVIALQPMWLGQPLLAGSIGVLLGLFICSLPAANAIDLFFFGRVGRYREYSRQEDTAWFVINAVVMIVGVIVIVIGATRFSSPGQ